MEPFVGEIRAFAFTFAPRNWAYCAGQLIPLRQNTALYALIGTTFGGDGTTTFGLPNLVGSVAVGTGQRPGGQNWSMGQVAGSSGETLNQAQIPAHVHGLMATSNGATGRDAAGNQLALASVDDGNISADALIYANGAPDVALTGKTMAMAGGGQAHPNMMPVLTMGYCIALVGIYPSFG